MRRGVYDGSNKLTVVHDRVEALYDVASDPTEMRDVSVGQAALVADLQGKLNNFVKVTERENRDSESFGDVDDSILDNLKALGYIE